MAEDTDPRDRTERVAATRLRWIGPLAAVAAAAANVLVRAIAVALFGAQGESEPLQPQSIVMASVVGALGATVVFAIVARFARRPIWLFRVIATILLVLSFATPFTVPAANAPTIATLLVMHLVAAVVSVGLLTTLAVDRRIGA